MRVIFTFDEIHASNDLTNKVVNRLKMVAPGYAKDLEEIHSPLAKLDKLAGVAPEMVKVDYDQKLVIFSIPEEMTLDTLEVVDEFYMDLLDLVPAIISIIRLFNKAASRYEAGLNKVAGKFKLLLVKQQQPTSDK
jgi:hypothetical protein